MRILITAGPTWVKIDDIRIITTIFTGNTGLFLAENLTKKGFRVDLLINDYLISRKINPNINKVSFRYFEEFEYIIKRMLTRYKYKVIIHNCAVSDYILDSPYKGKIPSNRSHLTLRLKKTPKIIKFIRSLSPDSFLVQFKLEITPQETIEEGYKSLLKNKSNLVVANAWEEIKKGGYKGYIIDGKKNIIPVYSYKDLLVNLYNRWLKVYKK